MRALLAFLARSARSLLLALLSFVGLACAPLLNGSPAPPPRAHFVLVVHNQDVAFADTASVCWWMGSSIVGSSEVLMPAGGAARFDLGTVHPDGLQIVATAWNGILMGPGGNVFSSPNYSDAWTFNVDYPSGFTWK